MVSITRVIGRPPTPIYDASALPRFLAGLLIVALGWAPSQKPAAPPAQAPAPAAAPEFKDLAALMTALPPATVKPLDAPTALLFTALPLTCVDDLQPRPTATRPYFWQPTYRTVDAYDKTRAFYGCNDWPTAVGATWTLVDAAQEIPGPRLRPADPREARPRTSAATTSTASSRTSRAPATRSGRTATRGSCGSMRSSRPGRIPTARATRTTPRRSRAYFADGIGQLPRRSRTPEPRGDPGQQRALARRCCSTTWTRRAT